MEDVTEEQVQRTFMERVEDYTPAQVLTAVTQLSEMHLRVGGKVTPNAILASQAALCSAALRLGDETNTPECAEVMRLLAMATVGLIPLGEPPS